MKHMIPTRLLEADSSDIDARLRDEADDIAYMTGVAAEHGMMVAPRAMAEIWLDHSDSFAAGWLRPGSDEEILSAITARCEDAPPDAAGATRRPIELRRSPDEDEIEDRLNSYGDDVDHMVSVAARSGVSLDPRDAVAIWMDHSEMVAAGWLAARDDDEILWAITSRLPAPVAEMDTCDL